MSSAGQLINIVRMRCQAVVQAQVWIVHPILSPGHVIEINETDEIKDPCDNKHENLCKTSPCHFIFMPLL